MSTYKNQLVEIPEDKGVHTKSAGARKEKYVYKYTKYYRNAEGEPRNNAKLIGKYDADSGKMHPNDNYFEIYQVDVSFPDISITDYGYTYLVNKICQDTGLLKCLKNAFGKSFMEIIVMAAYMIREGNAMDGIDDWQERNCFPWFDKQLTSQKTSKAFGAISEEQQETFFKDWIKTASAGGKVFYDVTSISSYAQDMTEVEHGYNRDKDDLPQYNLGMFCDETNKLPLYYNRYNGSLTDKTNLSYVLENAKSVGIENVKMFLDGGFWSGECMQSLNNCCDAFTVGMPASLKEAEKIIADYGRDIEKYENELPGGRMYCVQTDSIIYGIEGRVLLYYDLWNHVNLCSEMSARIEGLKDELSKLKRYPKSKLSRFKKYFTITKNDNDNGFDYHVDTEKVEKLRKSKGFFLLFTTDMESSPEDILYYYRAKDIDEKIFSQIKVDMEGGRIRTHSTETTNGKTFVTFVASIIRSYMLNKLTPYINKNSTSLKKVLNQLSNIAVTVGQGGYRFTKALTKKQKEILLTFNADSDIVESVKDFGLR